MVQLNILYIFRISKSIFCQTNIVFTQPLMAEYSWLSSDNSDGKRKDFHCLTELFSIGLNDNLRIYLTQGCQGYGPGPNLSRLYVTSGPRGEYRFLFCFYQFYLYLIVGGIRQLPAAVRLQQRR